jgi:hypothetical protein
MRKIHNELVQKNTHSINFNDFDAMTGNPIVQIRTDFVGNKQEIYAHTPNRSAIQNAYTFKPSKENFTRQVEQSVFLPEKGKFATNSKMFSTQQRNSVSRHKASMSFVPNLTSTSTSQFSFSVLSPMGG